MLQTLHRVNNFLILFRPFNDLYREPPLEQQNNFKPPKTMFTIKIVPSFSNESVYIRNKLISKTLILAFKLPGRRHLD